MRLSGPDGFLIAYNSNRGIPRTYAVSRVTDAGKAVWTVGTHLQHLEQILPGSHSIAFIGKQLRPEATASNGPMLVLINNESGAVSTHPLWVKR